MTTLRPSCCEAPHLAMQRSEMERVLSTQHQLSSQPQVVPTSQQVSEAILEADPSAPLEPSQPKPDRARKTTPPNPTQLQGCRQINKMLVLLSY